MPNWKRVIVSGSDAILNTLNLTSTPNSVGDILTIDSNGVIGKRTTGNILDDISAVPTSRTLTAGNGLTGGGNLTANRTFTLGTPSNITLSSTNSVTSTSHTHAFAPGGTTSQYIRGDGSLATFPTIGNGTLTLATSGIATGSQTFTANQTGGSTFTVNVPATNIAQGTRTATTVPITSSTGTNATLNIASTTLAGVISAADKTKLDGIATGAQTGTVTSITAGSGLSGGTITTSGTIAVDGTVVRTNRQVIAGNGLTGGGTLNVNRTLTVGAGSGISVSSTAVAVDSTVVRTTGNQTIGGVKTFTSNILVNNTILSNQQNLDVDTGALRLIAQISSTSHDAAFFDFVIKKGNDLRAGTVYAVHNGTTVEFTETSTNDIGNTNEVVLSVDISGGNVRLLAKTDTNDWQIKTLVRGI